MRATVEATIEVDIARPRAAVWEFVTDPARSPEWIDEFLDSHLVSAGEPGLGSVVSYTIKPGPRTGTMEVTDGTHLLCHFRPELIGATVLLKPYLRRWLKRQRSADALRLKAILEADDA